MEESESREGKYTLKQIGFGDTQPTVYSLYFGFTTLLLHRYYSSVVTLQSDTVQSTL